jgi:hypothetical protein
MNKSCKFGVVKIIFFSAFLFSSLISPAESDPITYGKIDKSLLEMKVYEKDSTADAVIICDFGEFDSNTFTFTRTFRLKVLKKSGCDRANLIMSNYSRSDFKGCTYNLVNGEIEKTRLKNESIFEEDIDKQYFRYKVTMPNVQVGSVIDIQTSFRGIPSEWHFQSNIPVVWSEIRLYSPVYLDIQKKFYGFESFSISEANRWVCKDMPALKEEPFMNDLDNFLTKFEIEPGIYSLYTGTWDATNYYLLHESTLGKELETIFFMADEARVINESYKTQKEKLTAAYEIIKKEIRWDDNEYLYPRYNISLKDVLKKGSGNAGEVNLSLLLLLKKLNIEAYPVVLSTRRNGMLALSSPTLKKLNYLIVLANIDGQEILLDATDELLPAGYLPQRCINGNGRLVREANSIWIELKPGGADKIKQLAQLTFDSEGKIAGTSQCVQSDYAAYLFRKNYAGYNDKIEYTRGLERTNPGLNIKELRIGALDSIYNPIQIEQTFDYSSNIDVSDSLISFLPIIFDRLTSNPFNLDVRKIPVDFINPFERAYYYNYKIPIGYKVQEIPKSVNLTLPDNGGRFFFNSAVSDSTILITYKFSISKAIFAQDQYNFIKQLYAEVVKKMSEPVILKKTNL